MRKSEIIKEKLIRRSFPELYGLPINIYFKNIPDEFMGYGVYKGEFFINITRTILSAKKKVFVGCLSHELAHILIDLSMDDFERKIDEFLYKNSRLYRRFDERRTDRLAIERGFGKELLAFSEWALKYRDDDSQEGLTIPEIKKFMKKRFR